MPTMILRPSSDRSRSGLPAPYSSMGSWSTDGYARVSDASDSTYATIAGNTLGASYWNLADSGLAANAIINSVTIFHRVKVTATDPLYFAPESQASAYQIGMVWSDSFYNRSFMSNGLPMRNLGTDGYVLEWAPFSAGPFTTADVNNMCILIASTGNGYNGSSYTTYIMDVWVVVDYEQYSTPTGIGPNAVVNTSQPTLTYQHSDPDGEVADAYRCRVIDLRRFPTSYSNSYNVFNDIAERFLWDSGVVAVNVPSGSQFQVALPVSADNLATYRAYIQVRAGGVWSQPDVFGPYAYFTVKSRQPAAPRLTLEKDDVNKAIRLNVNSSDNLMTEDAAMLSSSTGGWANSSNAGVTRVTGQTLWDATTGAVLRLTAVANGDYVAGQNLTQVVTAGRVYSGVAKYRGQGGSPGTENGKGVRLDIVWYDAGDNVLGTTVGKMHSQIQSTWAMVSTTAKAPATAVKARVYVRGTTDTAAPLAAQFCDFSAFGFWAGPVNFAGDPLLQFDLDGDGTPDGLTKYVFPNTGSTATITRDVDLDNVYAGQSSIKIHRPPGNTDVWWGFYENMYLAKGKRYTVHIWCRALVDSIVGAYAPYGKLVGPVPVRVTNSMQRISFSFTQVTTQASSQVYYRLGPDPSSPNPVGVDDLQNDSWILAVMVEPERDDVLDLIPTGADSGFDSGTIHWASTYGDTLTSLASSTDSVGQVGTSSLKAVASASHSIGYTELIDRASSTFPGFLGRPIAPGEPCHVSIAAKTPVGGRGVIRLMMQWHDASGNSINSDSALANGSLGYFVEPLYELIAETLMLNSSVLQTIEGWVTPPANAAYGQVTVRHYKLSLSQTLVPPATSDALYIDEVFFKQRNWCFSDYKFEQYSYGGTFYGRKIQIQRANVGWQDFPDNLTIWQDVFVLPNRDGDQNSEYYATPFTFDFFLPQGLDNASWYRIRTVAPDVNGKVTASDWSVIVRNVYIDPVTKPRLFSTSDYTKNMDVRMSSKKIKKTIQKSRTAHQPVGRDKPVMVSGPVRAATFPFSFYCSTTEIEENLVLLLDKNEDLLLRLPMEEIWVQLAGDYEIEYYTKDNDVDPRDTVISGTFQEIANPTL